MDQTTRTAEPKFRIGAALKIPGGFKGRVTAVYSSLEEVLEKDPDVQQLGPDKVIKGKDGGTPKREDQYFYRCETNARPHGLIVGEQDAFLLQQGPAT